VELRIIDKASIRRAVGELDALQAVEEAFRALATGRVTQPPPFSLEIEDARGEVHVKGAFIQGSPVFALKVASGFYRNPERGLPTGSGLVLVFDAESGFPVALLDDGGYLTEARTGAAGALSLRLLAPERLERIAVIGAGTQARYQMRSMCRVRRWGETVAWSPVPQELSMYCREMEQELDVPFRAAASPEECVKGADVVVTVTPSREPLVAADWLQPHATVIAVGADGPEKRELAVGVLARADKVVADSTEQCLRLGEIHHAVEAGALDASEIHAELGEVLVGGKVGREGSELIVCDLTGLGAQDAAIAQVAWELLA
jgi:ornithine cyclodeaminase